MSLTHIPAGRSAASLTQGTTMLRANAVKKMVNSAAEKLKAFDQEDGVDLNGDRFEVEVKDAKHKMKANAGGILSAIANPMGAMPKDVTGTGSFNEDGSAKKLDMTVKENFLRTEQFRFEAKDDGSKIYSGTDAFGYVTVREQKDGTLFILTGKDPAKDFAQLTSDEFQAPAASAETPETPEKEGLWRMVPGDTSQVENAVEQGKKTLGGWLNQLSDSFK